MALTTIIGSAGSGKSTHIYKKIIDESIANKDKNYLVIVPEQYTMYTQRLLVKMHPSNCIMNIDVLSFNRLAYRVFEELGVEVLDILDDVGKTLVLRKLVNDNIEKLGVLKKNITRVSYITQVKSLISEMTQYNITPEVLKEMIAYGPMSENFRRKASDLLVMYEAFLQFSEGKFITAEAVLAELSKVLADSKIVSGSTVVLDGFTGFTPLQYELVGNMMEICDDVFVTITGDIAENYMTQKSDADLFAMSAEFVQALVRIASYRKVVINDPILIDSQQGRLSNNQVLSHLEKNIFRNGWKKYQGSIDAKSGIKLVSLKNSRDELKYAAIEISKLIREGQMSYSQIAVVCPDLENYRYNVAEIWDNFQIPYFIDAKTEILFHPFVEAISSLFEIYDTNYSKDAVFRFLKTGFTDLTIDEIDYLENYIISTGIRGKKKYFHPFAIRSNTYKEDENLLKVNEIRESFIKPFKSLDEILSKENTVREIARALYVFLSEFNCEEKIRAKSLTYEAEGQAIKSKEYKQIYPSVMKLLDKMVAIIGDEVMPLQEFSDIFEAGLSALSIGVIPQGVDAVIVGDMERTRLDGIKVLFCLGASDNSIPKKVENGGILSQLEREMLLEKFEMAPSDRQKAFRQRFYLYMMLTKPSMKLVVTTPRVGGDGKTCNESYIFEMLMKMFDIERDVIIDFDQDDLLLSKTLSKQLLIDLMQKAANSGIDKLSKEEADLLTKLIIWAKKNDEKELYKLIDAAFFAYQNDAISEAIMDEINTTLNEDATVYGSVTKFEDYSACAYMYYLKHILKLQEREEAQLSSIDMGNFYHTALEKYGLLLKENNKKWAETTFDERQIYIDTAVQQTFEQMEKVATLEDATQRYIVDSMRNTIRTNVEIITEQISRGRFNPELFEEKFDAEITANDELVAKLHGKIDRVDLTEDDDRSVRIVDYKSSKHQLSLDECYYGLSLQLPIYMNAVLEKLGVKYESEKFHANAMLYYKIDNPFVKVSSANTNVNKAILEELKMTGLVSDYIDDIKANDDTIGPDSDEKTSSIIPIQFKAGGELTARSNAISPEAMQIIMDYSRFKAGEIASNILEGKFDCKPAKYKSNLACTYCKFKGVCHFNETTDGCEIKDCIELKDKAIELMTKAMEEDREEDSVDGAD